MPWIKIIYNTEIIINGKGKAMPNNFDFGSMVFNEAVMRERLAEDTYAALKDTIKRGAPLARHIEMCIRDSSGSTRRSSKPAFWYSGC